MRFNFCGIILFVRDVDMLKRFYTQHFNLVATEEITGEWVSLNSGNTSIDLHKIGNAYSLAEKEAKQQQSNCKLIFETTGNLSDIHQQFLHENIKVSDIQNWEGVHYLLFDGEDPEGNVFQVRAKKE